MRNSHWRSLLILIALVVVVLALGQRLGHRDGFVFAAALALSIIGALLWYGELRLLPQLNVEEVEGQDPWQLREALTDLCQRARLPEPRLFVFPSESPQALALGRSWSSGKIFLSQGLLKTFSRAELVAILAYNLMCIKSRATVAFTIASALSEAILATAGAVDWILNWLIGARADSKRRVQVVARTMAPLALALGRFAVGRTPYLAADRAAAQLIGDPRLMAVVLWKLSSYALTQPFSTDPAAALFFMVNPLTFQRWGRYFLAHPDVQERIRRLVGHYPL